MCHSNLCAIHPRKEIKVEPGSHDREADVLTANHPSFKHTNLWLMYYKTGGWGSFGGGTKALSANISNRQDERVAPQSEQLDGLCKQTPSSSQHCDTMHFSTSFQGQSTVYGAPLLWNSHTSLQEDRCFSQRVNKLGQDSRRSLLTDTESSKKRVKVSCRLYTTSCSTFQ